MASSPGNTSSVHTLRFQTNTADLKRQLDQADRELVQHAKAYDKAAAAARATGKAQEGFVKSTRAMARGTAEVSKSSKLMRANMQNLGYQLQDTVVQLEMGTHWTRVLGQQGSQVAGIFGNPWLTILSAAGAAVLGLAYSMGVFGKDADDATDAVDDLDAALSKVESTLNDVNEPLSELGERYGEFTKGVRESLANILELNVAEAFDAQAVAIENTAESFDKIASAVAAYQRIERTDMTGATSEQELVQTEALMGVRDDIMKSYKLTVAEAEKLLELQEAYLAAQSRGAVQEQLAAADAFYDLITRAYGTLQDAPAEVRALASAFQESATAAARLEVLTAQTAEHSKVIANNLVNITAIKELRELTAGGPDSAIASSRGGATGAWLRRELDKDGFYDPDKGSTCGGEACGKG